MKSETFFRECEFDRTKIDAENRTVPIAFSSEYPVDRGDFDEILDHTQAHCDISGMRGAPLLLQHRAYDPDMQIGIIDAPELGDDRKMRCVARFSRSARGEQIFQDVKDGVRRCVSVGYERTKELSSEMDPTTKRVKKRFAWRPFEGSFVTIPADPTAGVGRGQPQNPPAIVEPPKIEIRMNDPEKKTSDKSPQQIERERIQEISAAADEIIKRFPDGKDKFREIANDAINGNKNPQDAKFELFRAIPEAKPAKVLTIAELGGSEDDARSYSITRGIKSCLRRDSKVPDGLEGDLHKELVKRTNQEHGGFLVPVNAPVRLTAGRGFQRDLQVGSFGQGGAFVQTSIMTPIIEVLRNRMVCQRLGVQSLAGLEGNIAIPRQTGAATAYSLPELSTLTKSTQALDQIQLSPKRVGAWNDYSRQLLLQSSVDVENFIRDDLMKVVAIKWDYLILQGAGSNSEPVGVLNTPGISSVLFGAAATWAKAVEFETDIATANADVGRMAYITTPTVRGKWKTIQKATNYPVYLWESTPGVLVGGPGPDYGVGTSNDGIINGYRAAATNQILNNLVFFGNWEDAIHALWGGFDVIVNPYSRDTDAAVRITVNTFGDVAVRHAQSFAVSADAGNQ